MNSFGNASVDIDMLEREMSAEAAQDSTRRNADLSGNIAGMSAPKTSSAFSSSSSNRRGPMQEIRLDSEFDTLEEPVWDTVKRDMQTVGAKFGHVILPHGDKQQLLRDWDLWGPLFICVGLALLLQYNGGTEAAPQFTQVFTITFFGSVVVTANIKLLGGNISFFPISLRNWLLPSSSIRIRSSLFNFPPRNGIPHSTFDNFHRICLVDLCLNGIFGRLPTRKKRLLVIYPVFLFYFVVSWMIISHS